MMNLIWTAAYGGMTLETTVHPTEPQPEYHDEVVCPSGTVPFGGGAAVWSEDDAAAEYPFLIELWEEEDRFTYGWGTTYGQDVDPLVAQGTAWCVDASAARCVERTTVRTESVSSLLHLKAECPDGTFAIGGGFRMLVPHDQAYEVGPMVNASGEAIGWEVKTNGPVEAFARCVKPEVYALTDRHEPWLALPTTYQWLGDSEWGKVQSLFELPFVPFSTDFDSATMGLSVAGMDPVGDWLAVGAQYVDPTLETDAGARGTAADPEVFRDALELSCQPYQFPDDVIYWGQVVHRFGGGPAVPREAAVDPATSVFLPAVGPVPAGPQTTAERFAALPVAVSVYTDPIERDQRLALLTAAFDEAREAYAELDDVSVTLSARVPTWVVPTDEAAAIAWLSENREAVARLDHLTVVYLKDDGPGVDALAGW